MVQPPLQLFDEAHANEILESPIQTQFLLFCESGADDYEALLQGFRAAALTFAGREWRRAMLS